MIKNVISIAACLYSGFLVPVQSVQAAMGEASIPLPTTGESSLDAKFYLIIVLSVALIGVVAYLLGWPPPPPLLPPEEGILKEFERAILIKPQPTDEEKRVLGAYRFKYSQWRRDVGIPDDKSTAATIQIANLAVAWAFVEIRDYSTAWKFVPTEQIIAFTAKPSGSGYGSTNTLVSRKWHFNDAEPALRLELERARVLQSISSNSYQPQPGDKKTPGELLSECCTRLATPSSPIALEVEARLWQANGWNSAVDLVYQELNKSQNNFGGSNAARTVALPVVIMLLERTKAMIGLVPASLGHLPQLISEILHRNSLITPLTPDEIKLPGLYCEVVDLWSKKNPSVSLPTNLQDVAHNGLRQLQKEGLWINEGKKLRLAIVDNKIKLKDYLGLARQILDEWQVICKLENPKIYKLELEPYAVDLLECEKEDRAAFETAFIGEGTLLNRLRELGDLKPQEGARVEVGTSIEACGRWRFLDKANAFIDLGEYGGKSNDSNDRICKAVYYVFNNDSQREQFNKLKIQVKCGSQLLQKIGSFGHPLTQQEGIGPQIIKVTDEGNLTAYKSPITTEFTTLFEPMCGIDFSMLSVPHSAENRLQKVQIYSGTAQEFENGTAKVKEVDVARTAPEPVDVPLQNVYNMAVFVGITCGIDEHTPENSTPEYQVDQLLKELARHLGPIGQEDRGFGAEPVDLFKAPVNKGSSCTLRGLALSKEAEARRSDLLRQAVPANSRHVTEAKEMYEAMPLIVREAFARFLEFAFHKELIGRLAYTKLKFLKEPTISSKPIGETPRGGGAGTPPPPPPPPPPEDNLKGLANFLRMPIERVQYRLSEMGAIWRKYCESKNEHELAAYLRGLGY